MILLDKTGLMAYTRYSSSSTFSTVQEGEVCDVVEDVARSASSLARASSLAAVDTILKEDMYEWKTNELIC